MMGGEGQGSIFDPGKSWNWNATQKEEEEMKSFCALEHLHVGVRSPAGFWTLPHCAFDQL